LWLDDSKKIEAIFVLFFLFLLLWERKLKKKRKKIHSRDDDDDEESLSNAAALDFQKIFKKFSKKKSRRCVPFQSSRPRAKETHERR